MQIPDAQYSVTSLIDKYHEENQEPPRPHMGCSLLGHSCDRFLWLSFRWAVVEKFPGRILRLFRRGQNEEATVVADLESIGCVITDTGANQSRVDFGSHVSGSLDGVIQSGLPGGGSKAHVLEIKTHSQKSFDTLKKEGVRKAKFQHFIQMQVYMLGKGLERALYVAVNKNTDEIYTERVYLDADIAQKAIERGRRIALADRMPESMPGASPSWYECKYCPAFAMCWKEQPTKEVNCRTCAHSTACSDSTWQCVQWDAQIPVDAQRQGCTKHVLHPDLVPWRLDDSASTADVAAYVIDGRIVRNGEGFKSSKEILDGIL